MKTKKTIVISHETYEELSIRLSLGSQIQNPTIWCIECAPGAPLIAPEAAASLAGTSIRSIYRLVEAESIHFQETPDGPLLVCVNDLMASRQVSFNADSTDGRRFPLD